MMGGLQGFKGSIMGLMVRLKRMKGEGGIRETGYEPNDWMKLVREKDGRDRLDYIFLLYFNPVFAVSQVFLCLCIGA